VVGEAALDEALCEARSGFAADTDGVALELADDDVRSVDGALLLVLRRAEVEEESVDVSVEVLLVSVDSLSS
jgi:hypothetical protein